MNVPLMLCDSGCRFSHLGGRTSSRDGLIAQRGATLPLGVGRRKICREKHHWLIVAFGVDKSRFFLGRLFSCCGSFLSGVPAVVVPSLGTCV